MCKTRTIQAIFSSHQPSWTHNIWVGLERGKKALAIFAVEANLSNHLPVGTEPFTELHRRWGDKSSAAAKAALLCLNTFSPRVSIGLKKKKNTKRNTEEKNDLIQSWLNSMGRLPLNFNKLQQAHGARLT